jgi:alpha-D-xyloside xylohydrolase
MVWKAVLFARGSVLVLLALLAACGGNGDRAEVTVDDSSDPITVATRAMRVEISRAPLRLALRAGDGGLLTREPAAGGLFYVRDGVRHGLAEVTGTRVVENGIELTALSSEGHGATIGVRFARERTLEIVLDPPAPESVGAVGERWESPPDEHIYGLTQRLRDSPLLAPGVIDIPIDDVQPREVGSLNRRGETVEMFIRPTLSLYAPFYHSSRGYGVAVAGTMPGRFDLASTDPKVLSFELETGTLPANRRLKFHVFAGPEHATILDEYTALTGRPFVPPDWAFLNWRWRGELAIGPPAELDGAAVNAQVAEDVRMFEELGIPAGVYLFDRPVLEGEFGFARFAWDEQRLPNPRAMLDALRRRGYRIAMWSATWMCGSSPGDNGFEAQRLGFIAPGPVAPPRCADVGGSSFILDVTNAAARDWFRGRLSDFLAAHGIDAIKLDRGEEHIPSAATDRWADGRRGREVHNDYVVLQTRLHREALAAAHPEGEYTVLTRSGYTGVQQDAVFWGGDIAGSESFGFGPSTDLGLRSAIIGQQRAAFMGFPIWGSDTGGYYEFKDREVFARWIEVSAFSGIMEIGGTGNHAPWDMPTEPRFDAEMIDIYRRYTRLRETMLPYILAAAREAGESGLPIVRPMVFLDRNDPELLDRWDQYLFGPDLLVAPAWRVGQRSRDVYLPRGSWRSLWDETVRYEGPVTISVEAPLDTIPVFVRGEDTAAPFR